MGSAVKIAPFWQKLTSFWLLPIQKSGLITMLSVSLLSLLLPFLGLAGVILSFFVASYVFKYSFMILERCSYGDLRSPGMGEVFDSDGEYLFFKLLLFVFFLYGAVIWFVGTEGLLFSALIGLVTFFMPAITVALAVEKSITVALNPLVLVSFILRMGLVYVLVWVSHQFILSLSSIVASHFSTLRPFYFAIPLLLGCLVAWFNLYFWFVANAMLGYSVYERDEALGHESYVNQIEGDDSVAREVFDYDHIVAEGHILLKGESLEATRLLIGPALDLFPVDSTFHQLYHRVLAALGADKPYRANANFLIELLLKLRGSSTAAIVFHQA
ncbi:MAG: hypothetical protein ACI93R_000377 [Flavobacteriales bacterium]